jgi:hypothetical protein
MRKQVKTPTRSKKVSKEAWMALSGKEILYVGGCDLLSGHPINHLEIYPTKRDALNAVKDDEGVAPIPIVKCTITYTLPKITR